MLECNILTHARGHRRAQESSAANMDQTATALNQQSHIELPEKMSSLCEMLVKEIATLTLLPTSFAICGN